MIFPKNVQDLEYLAVINKEIKKVKLSDFKTRYLVLIFYPLDFTFVCPTEITKLSDIKKEFINEDSTVIYVSSDSVYSHLKWINTSREENGISDVSWPLISDICRSLSSQFNLFNEDTGTVMRSTVILDNNLKVLHISANIDPIGRSSSEILRLLKALRFYEKHGEVCPVDFMKN